MKKVFILAMMFVIGFSTAYAETGDDALGVAYKSGEITKNTYVIERLKSVLSQDNVNPLYRRTESDEVTNPVRDFTLLLRYALINIDSFSPEDQEIIRMFQKRPTDATNTSDTFGGGWHLPADATSTTAAAGKYRIHYTTTTTADSGRNVHQTQESFVTSLKTVIDTVYASEITTMGYSLPPDDGNAEFDIYIMNCGSAAIYGYVAVDDIDAPVGDGNEYTSFMVIDNDFSEFQNTPIDSMRVTFAHEFHHAIQNGINGLASAWYYETTATWIEEQVYDSINDNRQYLSSFFNNPERSLDTTDPNETYQYSTWLFNEYLASKWTPEIIKDIWTALDPDGSYVPLDAVMSVIVAKGSTCKDTFTDFVAENYSKSIYSESADDSTVYASVKFHESISMTNAESTTAASTTIDHLASKYIKITPSSSATATLTITINGADSKDLNAVAIVNNSGTYSKHSITLDSTTNEGSVAIADFSSSNMTEVVLALVNYSKAQDSSEITFSAVSGQSPVTQGSSSNSSGGSSSGCFIDMAGFFN